MFKDQFARHALSPFQRLFVERVQDIEDQLNENALPGEHFELIATGHNDAGQMLLKLFHHAADGQLNAFPGLAANRQVDRFRDVALLFPDLGTGVPVIHSLEERTATSGTPENQQRRVDLFLKRITMVNDFAADVRAASEQRRPNLTYHFEQVRTRDGRTSWQTPAPAYDARFHDRPAFAA